MEYMSNYTFDKVEGCICGYFNLELCAVKSKCRKSELVNARKFIVCILHDEYKYSISTLAKHYGMSEIWIKQQCAQIRSLCSIYQEYKKHYDVITTVLLDLDYA